MSKEQSPISLINPDGTPLKASQKEEYKKENQAEENTDEKDPSDKSEGDLPKLHDHRKFSEWHSVYKKPAPFWIYAELIYLLIFLITFLCVVGLCGISRLPEGSFPAITMRPFGTDVNVLFWISIFSSGTLGGTIMALKWHYHCVAKKLWHADRRVWRITTPLLSGVIALFTIMLVVSGVMPILDTDQIARPIGGAAVAFLLGLFADNILAALQNFAQKTFGTLREIKKEASVDTTESKNG